MLDMGGVREILLIAVALMAYQAAFGVLSRIRLEREDQFVGSRGLGVVALGSFLGVGMRFPGSMTHLATGHRIRFHRLDLRVVELFALPAEPIASGRLRFDASQVECEAALDHVQEHRSQHPQL